MPYPGLNSPMLIDVIIPTYNRAHLLERAILSVLNQTYKNFVLHIVDDGSTDETNTVLKKYKDQITLHTQKNKGVSAARNLAAFKSTGDWIAFLDSDDEWTPRKLEIQIQALKDSPTLRFFHSEEIWMRNNVRVNPKVKHQKSGPDLLERSLEFCLISPSTSLIRRDLFLEQNGFDESFIVCEDYDLWLKILAREDIGFIPDALTIKYGGHEDQLSTAFAAMDYWRIKSLIGLYQQNDITSDLKQKIKAVVMRKSEILLKGYVKHQNNKAHEEIMGLIACL